MTTTTATVSASPADLPPAEVNGAAVRWTTLVRPYRSASQGPLIVVATTIAASSFVAGISVITIGAWPILGFLGLDILGLYIALRLNRLRAREYERLTLTTKELLIDRVDHWGRHRQWSVPPHWLRVKITELPREQQRLELHTHGRVWIIGKFLHPSEKEKLAGELSDAIRRLGAPPGDQRSFTE